MRSGEKGNMLDEQAFGELVDEIKLHGYDEETACGFAARIGDTPELDAQGNVLVRDKAGKLLATLKLKFFDDSPN